MIKLKIKKNDQVKVITGKDKGKVGKVIKVIPKDLRVIVEGVNMCTKHVKPSQNNRGGLLSFESPIHVSNVSLIEPGSDNVAVKVGYSFSGDKKVRVSRKTGKNL